jgi:hypothetical protein
MNVLGGRSGSPCLRLGGSRCTCDESLLNDPLTPPSFDGCSGGSGVANVRKGWMVQCHLYRVQRRSTNLRLELDLSLLLGRECRRGRRTWR